MRKPGTGLRLVRLEEILHSEPPSVGTTLSGEAGIIGGDRQKVAIRMSVFFSDDPGAALFWDCHHCH
ncbi:MAG: hypothetical protein JO356_20495 [Acidobacteria bacterium]|nr:hypothetical protein [Acidobacteriota bacterium]